MNTNELATHAVEYRDAFDPDFDRITSLEVIREHGDHVYVHVVVMTDVDPIDADPRVPVETIQVIIRAGVVVSTERLSLHLI